MATTECGDGSLGYASRLSYREDLGGQLGDPELNEGDASLATKAERLAQLIADSKHFVAFTGAGISTSTGIPDFRGPNGVWTKQRRGEPLPKASTPFEHARPSLTHQALLGLQRVGKLHFLVSQNVDSLHLRSGFPRASLAELHGNCFAERCTACKTEYVRDFEVGSVGFKPTGRTCIACGGVLCDQCLDWDDALPEDELLLAESHAAKADLALCLGTSLVIVPARDIPLRVRHKRKHKPSGGQLVIANLQATPLDRRASLVVHTPVDQLMARVMAHLQIPIPVYCRQDVLHVTHESGISLARTPTHPPRRAVRITLSSSHGKTCPLPWLQQAVARWAGSDQTNDVITISPPSWSADVPMPRDKSGAEGTSEGSPARQLSLVLSLQLSRGLDAPPAILSYPVDLSPSNRSRRGECTTYTVTTCRQTYDTLPWREVEPVTATKISAEAASSSASTSGSSSKRHRSF